MPPAPLDPLISDLAQGRPEAYAALYDRWGRGLFRVALAMEHSPDQAEDAVQELFVNLVRFRDRLPQVQDLQAYLFSCLRNVVIQRRARQGRERSHLARLALAATDTYVPPPAPDADLAAMLATLPPEQREVVTLKIDGDLTFAQIAAVLNISLNTAASRYRYALEKLRHTLEGKP